MGEMMTMEKYERPALKFVALRNEETVANTCWGVHGTEQVLYCDIPGEGYFSFQIAGGSCALNVINVVYYDGNGVPGTYTDAQYNELEAILRAAGGSQGNPYKGTEIVDSPSESWS